MSSRFIFKSKKFQYAVFFLLVAALLVFLPVVFKLNPLTAHLLNKMLSADIFIGSLVIGGHSLTDAVFQYVNRPQFKELVSEISPVLEAAGIDKEVEETILDFLKQNGVQV